MSFQDELRASTNTPEEVAKKQQQKRDNEIYEMAESFLRYIETSMKSKAENGNYIKKDGKRIVTFMYWMNAFDKCVIRNRSDKHEDKITGPLSSKNLHLKRTYELSLKDDDVRSRFLDVLEQEAKKDNVYIEPIITYQYKYSGPQGNIPNENYREIDVNQFPVNFTVDFFVGDSRALDLVPNEGKEIDENCCRESDFHFCIKATCEIPDTCSEEDSVGTNQGSVESDEDISMTEENKPSEDETSVKIDNISGEEFERLCADLLSKNGFNNVHMTQETVDQGIDVIAMKDGIKYGLQCKMYSGDVGNKAVQEALAGKTFYKCHVGVVLTNSHFTKAAQELANADGIALWGRNKLLELIANAGYTVQKA